MPYSILVGVMDMTEICMRNDQNEKNGRLTLERYMRRAEGCCLQTIMRPSHLSAVSLL